MAEKSPQAAFLEQFSAEQRLALVKAAITVDGEGNEVNVFEGRKPVPGLEHLGRAIVDRFGQPSGSPANYENTRGLPDPEQDIGDGVIVDPVTPPAAVLTELKREFGVN